jgi:sugar phosphate isomerase/epimerase
MQYGISTHLYHGVRLDRDHLVEIAAHGFEAVELFATRTHFDYHDQRAIGEIEGHVVDAGLRVHAVHAPITEGYRDGVWGPGYSVAHGDDASRRLAVQETVAAIQAAHRLGADVVIVHPGTPALEAPHPKDNRRQALVRSIGELAEVSGPLGIKIALEVIPNPIADADALVRLLEDELEEDGLGICLDTGHAFILGDVTEAIEAASGYLVTTHLHDNDGTLDLHQVPFGGAIDWPSALMAFRKVGYDGTWVFELAGTDPPRVILERAQRARHTIERLLTT